MAKNHIECSLEYLRKVGAKMKNAKQINLIVGKLDEAVRRFGDRVKTRELKGCRISRFYKNLLALKSKIIAKQN